MTGPQQPTRPLRIVGAGTSIRYIPRDGMTLTTTAPHYVCPDLLSIRHIGMADGWRGHAVRGFFKLLKLLTGV